MLVDWFTVGAQVVNFAVLAWLLKRLLYRPILDAIDAREKRLAQELADADAAKAMAEREREEFARKNAELEAQRADHLSRSIQQAKVEGERLLAQARREADDYAARRRDALMTDARNFDHALSRRVQEEVFAIVRKVLGDLAAAGLEERMAAEFIGRLRGLQGHSRSALVQALKANGAPALIRSAFDLPASQQEAIRRALDELVAAPLPVRFETAPEVVSGIELTTPGQKLGWSIGEYLRSLEQSVTEVIAEQVKAPSPAASSGERPQGKHN